MIVATEDRHGQSTAMTPAQIQILRKLALHDDLAIKNAMTGNIEEFGSLGPQTESLVRIASLVGSSPDCAYGWATDEAMAAGVEDEEIFMTLIAIAPVVGTAKVATALPALMAALDIEVIED